MLATRLPLIIRRTPILASSLKQVVRRPKTTYVYEYDKTFAQKWVAGRTKKIQEFQKLLLAEDGAPLWWKTTSDKVLTVVIFAGVAYCVTQTLYTLILYAYGKI